MSRAAKAAAAKDKTKPPPSTPVVCHDIVPGKFNENDWNVMLERDFAEDFVLEFLDEVMASTMDTIYQRYIQRQLLPFTITQAKDAILQIIEWQFLARDEGERNMADSSWIQDEEPEAAVTDCWAQGSVPRTEVPPPPIPEEPEAVEEEAVKEEPPKVEIPVEPELPDTISDSGIEETKVDVIQTDQVKKEEEKEKKVEPEKRRSFRPYRGKMKSAGVSKMTESLDETEMKLIASEIAASMPEQEVSSNLLTMPMSCNSILKVQNGRPPGNKDVQYDRMGNVVAVMKLDPEHLPNHRVNVKYSVVDPAVEASQNRLEAMRRGRYIAPSQSTQRIKKGSEPTAAGGSATIPGNKSSLSKQRKPVYTQLPPSVLDTVELARGVQVTEGGRTKRGPNGRGSLKSDAGELYGELHPVTIRIQDSGITVSDLLDRNTPILRPLQETPPLPPIMPQPPKGAVST